MDTDKSDILKSLFIGCGFLEKVHENSLAYELRKAGFKVSQQHEIKVYYDGVEVGKYVADLFVEDYVIVEVKAISGLDGAQICTMPNYLKATKLKVGLLINFGKPKIEVKRVSL